MTPYQALSIQIAAAARGFIPDARLVEEAAHWTGKEFAEKKTMSRLMLKSAKRASLIENLRSLRGLGKMRVR
jgi:hypothetical protein